MSKSKPLNPTSKIKALGAFYTPRFIVDYILDHTLGKLLKEGVNPYAIRILDPACGDGRFLVGAFDVLDRWLAEHGTPEDQANPRQRRLKILQNNLYGVDLDPQAIEVAQLNLLIRAAHERGKLPMLEHLRDGNSLIDDESVAGDSAFKWAEQFPEVMSKGGFDVVVGNPPYVRIQNVSAQDANWLKKNYQTPWGNYDLYIPFIERGLSLLNEQGVLGMILPNKFFTTQYGHKLRGYLTQGQHLTGIVNFKEHQLFEEATTYTCILNLSKQPSPSFLYADVLNLDKWIEGDGAKRGILPAPPSGEAVWNFVVGDSANLFQKFSQMPTKLGNIAHLFVGLQTDADDIFIVETIRTEGDKILCYSRQTGQNHWFEAEHLKPLLKGAVNIHRYRVLNPTKRLIFPYQMTPDNKSHLIPSSEYVSRYPLTWEYLTLNRDYLSQRHGGQLEEEWYGYVYKKNHTRFAFPKLVVPSIAEGSRFMADLAGHYYFVGSGGGGGGGYGIVLNDDQLINPLYLLGILNSKVVSIYLQLVGSTFRGGYIALNRQYIEQAPIYIPDLNKPNEKTHHDQIVEWVGKILKLQEQFTLADAQKTDKRHTLARQITELDQQIDKLVYQLYGVTDAEIEIITAKPE